MYAIDGRLSRRFLMAGAVLLLLVAGSTQVVHGQQPVAEQQITVQMGDTLWSIATARYPDADPREKVGEIMQLNGLHDPALQVGEHLKLPSA